MAYSVRFSTVCMFGGCTKAASERVLAYGNEDRGVFCRQHARQRVQELTKAEANNPNGFPCRAGALAAEQAGR